MTEITMPTKAARRGSPPSQAQRIRILSAMERVAVEHGPESATVERVIALARVSEKAFYANFENRSECLDAVFAQAVSRARERACASYDPSASWVDRVRSTLSALLELLAEEPELGRVCVAHALASPPTMNGRRGALQPLTRLIDEGRGVMPPGRKPPPLDVQVVLGRVLGLIYARLIAPDSRSLMELLNPLTSMIVLPYLGKAALERQLGQPVPKRARGSRKPKPTGDPTDGLKLRLTYRTLAVLEAIRREPGLSNVEICDRAGVTDQGQMSKLLKRVASHDLAQNFGAGHPQGEANAWMLTTRGRELLRSLEIRR
jgi:AcrR family transcriptional regulator